jgi:type I restriction enzyme M protein
MNQQKHLGQYFTPPAIAGAMSELVKPLLPPNPFVVDLACGEGILLSKVLEQGMAVPDRIWGLDIDSQMKAIWEENEILSDCHLLAQDGLSFELDTVGLEPQGVDLAIGNPPFNRAQNLVTNPDVLKDFQLGRRSLAPAEESLLEIGQLGFEFEEQGSTFLVRIFDQVQTVVSQPVEALFLEKFIQVTRPGGYIVIILPEGLLSNEGSQDVRDFMIEQTDVLAIIGLPRRVFDNDAKTSILLLRRKQKPRDRQQELVFLATASKGVRQGDSTELNQIVHHFHHNAVA